MVQLREYIDLNLAVFSKKQDQTGSNLNQTFYLVLYKNKKINPKSLKADLGYNNQALKIDNSGQPVTDWGVATFQKSYDPYLNPWHI